MTVEPPEPERPPVPNGWRTGPAWREMSGKAARDRWLVRGFGTAAGLAAAAVITFNPGNVLSHLPGQGDKVEKTTAAALHRPIPTLGHPFVGSPAKEYADGDAGIVLPEATAVGGLPKEQVASALATTKKFLVAANLDPAVIRGERPEAAIDLVEPHQKNTIANMAASLTSPDQKHDPLLFFSRFDPHELRLAGGTVKTHGRMTFEAGRKKGSVLVHCDYLFVYPVMKTSEKPKPSAEVARTVVRRVIDTEVFDPDHYSVTPGKVDLHSVQLNVGNFRCGVHDGFLHPHFRSEHRKAADQPSGEAVDPYDQNRQLPGQQQCNRTTRT
ncbi:hypothetical protein ACWD4B_05585 [Streptomyces sp. NPDC002536]